MNIGYTSIFMGLFLVGIIFTSIPSAEAIIAEREGTLVSERMNAWNPFPSGSNELDDVTDTIGLNPNDNTGLFAQSNNQKNTFLVDLRMKGDPTILDCKITARMVKGGTFSGATKVFIIIEQSSKKISRGNDNFVTDSIQNFERVAVNNPLANPLRSWILSDFLNTGFGVEQATDNKRTNLTTEKVSCRVNDTVLPTITAPANIEQFATSPLGNTILDLGTPFPDDDIDLTPTVTISGIPAGNFFPIGTTTITYAVRDFAGNVGISATQTVTIVDPAPTTVILRDIDDTYENDIFTVSGELINDRTGLGIPGQTVKFSGTGIGVVSTSPPSPLPDAITGGFTATGSGIVINTVSGDNILRLPAGAILSIQPNVPKPTYVTLTLEDTAPGLVTVEVSPGIGTPYPSSVNVGPGGAVILTLFDPNGISSIRIVSVSSGTVGITQLQTLNNDQYVIIDEGFDTPTSSTPTSLSFAEGTIFSSAKAEPVAQADLYVVGRFDGSQYYLPSTPNSNPPEDTKYYSIFYNSQGGYGAANDGGAANAAAVAITARLCSDFGGDNDNDGLCNSWEASGTGSGPGIPLSSSSVTCPCYTLPGSNTGIKDIYVEVDYMTAHNPFVAGSANDGIDDVITVFADKGITLHVDQGDLLAHPSPLSMWAGFDTLKQANFGTPTERSSGLTYAKSQAYRYVIFAHSVGGASGVAEVKGNDMVIALGSGWTENNGTHTGTEGSRAEIAGTFMHELGHLLNLRHGGPDRLSDGSSPSDKDTNCKANHDSLMSYPRQTPRQPIGNNWRLDYSNGGMTSFDGTTGLKENSLVETGGNLIDTIPPAAGVYGYVLWGTPAVAPSSYSSQQAQSAAPRNNIDWSGGGISPVVLGADINNFGFLGCNTAQIQTTTYYNYDEWGNLAFNFREGIVGYLDSAHAGDDPQELDVTQLTQNNVQSAYIQFVSPWNPDGTIQITAGANLPIKERVLDGQNLELIDDGSIIVRYEIYDGNGVKIGDGVQSHDPCPTCVPGHFHAGFPTSKNMKSPLYVVKIISDSTGLVSKVGIDPDTDSDPNIPGKQPFIIPNNNGKIASGLVTLTKQ